MVVTAAVLAALAARPSRMPEEDGIGALTALEASGEAVDADGGHADIEVDWAYWHTVNPDVVAWIVVPGMGIDLPVVQAPHDDPDYYLTHDVYRNINPWGCPFIDADCAEGRFDGYNTVITGHNMLDGSMFQPLTAYAQDRTAMDAYPTVLVATPEGTLTYRVEASMVVDGDSALKQTRFDDQASFEAYAAMMLEETTVRASYDTPDTTGEDTEGEDVDAEEPFANGMLTLCTCSYTFHPQNERTLVLAERV